MSTFYIHTFGCQMNEYDSERLAQILMDAHWERVAQPETAKLLLLNTCTVRQLAEQKAFSLIGRWVAMKRQQPDLLIGMVGCLAQHLAQDIFKRAPEIDFLAGPRALTRVPELAEKARKFKRIYEFEDTGYGKGVDVTSSSHALQARVAVMEGCNQFCAYCAVPYARGREMSRPVEAILNEVQQRIASGAKEIMLLGQNVNHYGFDFKDRIEFADLLYRVAQLPGVVRIRFMTSHPKDFSPRLIEAISQIPKVAEALHLPLQSGSDNILKAMRRGYSFYEYSSLIKELRKAIPGLAISTDIIVGFPGETEVDFEASVLAIKEIGFDLVYCFKFSARKGTAAADLPAQVPLEIREKRLERLLEVVRETTMVSQVSWLDRQETVLIEEIDELQAGHIKGRTATNRWVSLPGPTDWLGREIPVKITAAAAWSLLGEPVV